MPAAAAAAPSNVARASRPVAGRARRNVRRRGAGRLGTPARPAECSLVRTVESPRRARGPVAAPQSSDDARAWARFARSSPRSSARPGRRSRRVRVGGPRPGRSGPAARRRTASTTSASVAPSRSAVGSSSRSRGASRRKARASATRWRSPAESPAPRSPSAGAERRPAARRPGRPRPAWSIAAMQPRRRRRPAGPSRTFVADRRGEEMWTLGHPGQPCGAMRPGRGRRDVDAADADRPSLRRDEAEHAPSSSVDLPQPLGPVMATTSPGSIDERHPVEGRLVPARVGDAQVVRPRAVPTPGRARRSGCPRRRRRLVEHAEHLLGGADAVGAGVDSWCRRGAAAGRPPAPGRGGRATCAGRGGRAAGAARPTPRPGPRRRWPAARARATRGRPAAASPWSYGGSGRSPPGSSAPGPWSGRTPSAS